MDIGWKMASAVAVAGAGILANAAVNQGWKLVTGRKPPSDGESEAQAGLLEVVVFSAISGIAVTLLQRGVLRKTNKWYGGRAKDPLNLGNHLPEPSTET